MRKLLLLLIAVVAGFGMGVYWWASRDDVPTVSSTGEALIGGEYTLTNHKGERVTDKTYHGKYAIYYFGYTFCPDICPTSLYDMMQAVNALGDKQEKITPIFVTVDPDRDTVHAMGEYVDLFSPRLQGLTGTNAEIEAIKKAFRVYGKKAPDSDERGEDYLVDHSSIFYIMDKNGRYVKHFSHGTTPEEMAKGLLEIL